MKLFFVLNWLWIYGPIENADPNLVINVPANVEAQNTGDFYFNEWRDFVYESIEYIYTKTNIFEFVFSWVMSSNLQTKVILWRLNIYL